MNRLPAAGIVAALVIAAGPSPLPERPSLVRDLHAAAQATGESSAPASPRLAALVERLAAGDRDAQLDRFWSEMRERGTPLVEAIDEPLVDRRDAADGGSDAESRLEEVLVTFLWRETSPVGRVALIGGPGGLTPADNLMARLEGTDVWFRSYRVRSDLRTTYRFSPDDSLVPFAEARDFQARIAGFVRDPLNPRTFVFPPTPGDPDATESVLSVVELDDAPPQPWIVPDADAPRGTLADHALRSERLGNERAITVYTPPGYDEEPGTPYPLMVLFDRRAYLNLVPTPTILDNLIRARTVPPLVAVLVGNVNRSLELPCHAPFADFLADELMPWVRSRYAVTDDPAGVVVAGSSYGGLAASCAALRHPGVFGNVISQSGSYWWAPTGDDEAEWLTRRYVAAERLDVRFHIDIGLLEDGPTRGGPSMLVTNRHLRDVLRAKGYRVSYAELNSGHDYVSWRGSLADGLIELLGARAGR